MSSSCGKFRGTSQTSDHATAKSQVVDGILEGSIVSLELLKSVADTISVPYLASCSQILLSILTAVSRSRENTELLVDIAERSVQVVATVEAQMKDYPPSPSIQRHVRTLEEALKSVEDCVKREGQRGFVYRVALSQRVRGRIVALEQKLQDALSMFQIKTLLSIHDVVESLTVSAKEQSSTLQRIEAKVTGIYEVTEAGSSARSGSNLKVVRYEDLDPLEELYLDSNYQIQSASVNNRMVITKVFHGRRAKQHWKATIDFSHRMIHPNLLHMKAISSDEAAAPFIVFGASCEGSVETRIASALVEDLNRSTRLGLKIVSGLSSGLNFLSMQGVPLASIGLENFEILITVEDAVVIGINPTSLTRICNENSSDTAEDESEEEALWRIFNDLCSKTFEDANHILYQECLDREKALPEEPGVEQLPPRLQQARSDDNSQPPRPPVRADDSLKSQEKPNVPPRRELVWMSPPQRGSATLALVAQHYKKVLTIPRPGETLLLRQLSARRATRTRHRCRGYRKEEITLTTTIQQSAIISHLTPLPRERCTVCGQVVEDAGVFNCVCGATEDDGVSPTIKCSICSTWQHLTCVNVPPRGPLYFSCNACTRVQPGQITYTTTVGPDGRVLYHPFRAVPASYQTPTGVVYGIQWVPVEATMVKPPGALPADADFAAAFIPEQDSHSQSLYKVKALFSYKADPSDPEELSFSKDEELEIFEDQGTWWKARKMDGSIGIVPPNHLRRRILPELPAVIQTPFKAKARYSYVANPDDPNELSFEKGDEFLILNAEGRWWQVSQPDQLAGSIVPSNYMLPEKSLTRNYE